MAKKINALVKESEQSVKGKEAHYINPDLLELERDINKKFGAQVVRIGFPYADDGSLKTFVRIPTGSVALDIALGGGIPEGRFTELVGDYSVGKSTLAVKILANAQKAGYVCALLDAEGTSDKDYLEYLGVDVHHLYYSRPDGLEEATQLLIDLQRSGKVHFAVLDSIEACPPVKEYEKDFFDTLQMGIKPRLLGEYFRKFQASNNLLTRNRQRPFTLIGVNQLRDKIGFMGGEFAPGGRSKNYAASAVIKLRRGEWIAEGKGDNKGIVGSIIKFKVEKNKTYKNMQVGQFDFYTDSDNAAGVKALSIDTYKEITQASIEYGLISRNGGWFTLQDGETKFQGVEKLIEYFRENPEQIKEYETHILDLLTKTELT
jgi:recombination protein RecA